MAPKMVTCVVVSPDYVPVPVHEMTLEQAREAVVALANEIQASHRHREMDREARELIKQSRERRRGFWG